MIFFLKKKVCIICYLKNQELVVLKEAICEPLFDPGTEEYLFII